MIGLLSSLNLAFNSLKQFLCFTNIAIRIIHIQPRAASGSRRVLLAHAITNITSFMNKRTLKLLYGIIAGTSLAASSIFSQTSSGTVTTINFQSLQQPGFGSTGLGFIYKTNNFVFADTSGQYGLAVYQTGSPYFSGTTMLFNNSNSDTSLSRVDGGAFDFLGIDLAPLSYPPQSGPICFMGYRGSVLVCSGTFNFIGTVDIQRFTPEMSTFCNVTEVRWPQQSPTHQFTNVLVRERSGSCPGPQIQIMIDACNMVFTCSYLRPGTSYTLQKSTDLIGWQDFLQFTSYSPTNFKYALFDPNEVKAFFRLKSAQ